MKKINFNLSQIFCTKVKFLICQLYENDKFNQKYY